MPREKAIARRSFFRIKSYIGMMADAVEKILPVVTRSKCRLYVHLLP
jgi:hypothetical protein